MTEADAVATAAWGRLLERLAEAGSIVTGPLGATNDRERAEGYRHVTRVLSIALEMLVEKADPTRPAFTTWMANGRKVMGDNPGTIYDGAIIDPAFTYRIAGNRGATTYLGVCAYGTGPDGARRVAANIDDTELTFGPDGSFELCLAAERPSDLPAEVAFLALDPDVTDLLVRQYFHDPAAQEPATLTIETVPDPGPPAPLTEERLAALLDAAGSWVRDTVEVETTVSAIGRSMTPAEILPGGSGTGRNDNPDIDWDVVARVQPTPAVHYTGAWFEDLADDEAIVVEGTLPPCRYASIHWLNRWMESGDYDHHQVTLTDRDFALDADRRFRVTIAARRPEHGDWLDTTGIRSGTITIRTLGADEPAAVTYQRIARR